MLQGEMCQLFSRRFFFLVGVGLDGGEDFSRLSWCLSAFSGLSRFSNRSICSNLSILSMRSARWPELGAEEDGVVGAEEKGDCCCLLFLGATTVKAEVPLEPGRPT